MSELLPTAILGAGVIEPDLHDATGASCKALIPLDGRPMIDRVLDRVREAALVGDFRVICAPDSDLLAHVGDIGAPAAGPGFLDSITAGFEALGDPDRLLIITADLPLITPEALDHFCREALQSKSSIVYSIVGRGDSERVFPGARRSWRRLRDGSYTGGNLGVINRQFILDHGQRIAEAFAGRKSAIRLANMLGWTFILRLLTGRLTVAEAARRAQTILGTDVTVVQSPYPEVGFDIDTLSNLRTVEAWLADHEAG